jgi:hypothetical protein
MNIFEQAAKLKIRFSSDRGNLSTEQLWELPLTSKVTTANLNSIAVALDAEIASTGKNRRIASAKPSELSLTKLEIVEHIMEAKQSEVQLAKQARADAETKSKLMTRISEIEDSELTEGKSLKQLKKEAAKL